MKKFALALATVALFAFPAFAGSTEDITGCATTPVDGSNYTVRVDTNCALSNDLPDGDAIIKVTGKALLDKFIEERDDADN